MFCFESDFLVSAVAEGQSVGEPAATQRNPLASSDVEGGTILIDDFEIRSFNRDRSVSFDCDPCFHRNFLLVLLAVTIIQCLRDFTKFAQ